jgi:hypothetical protein
VPKLSVAELPELFQQWQLQQVFRRLLPGTGGKQPGVQVVQLGLPGVRQRRLFGMQGWFLLVEGSGDGNLRKLLIQYVPNLRCDGQLSELFQRKFPVHRCNREQVFLLCRCKLQYV